ncbi:DUF6695 family protein [Prolixibacter sp. NT017]|uniref:DUF6695 family protein n=1 Tax=Prolixibacter sp. NT017 TaxID=2652390 RepID=UPI001277935C|nr:DUF6695 family protein [Prolixibacter sp. NT017]GET24403.1 hypothetical protein NT017_07320 [Prolixibacter sp. NT017]
MTFQKKHTGFAIAIAWPETWCKQSGAWYDGFINRIGISKHHYYKVGHAALVLIDDKTGKCNYFDFGRYHTPFQHGRVRSEMTDDGLKMKTVAKISADKEQILNFEEILTELQQNVECHGEGNIHASYSRINFEKAFGKASQMQQISPIRYGPFRYKGSNCSRFVNTVLRAGNPDWKSAFKLNFLVPLTPTPMNNVNSFPNKTMLPKLLPFTFAPSPITDKSKLKSTLKEPVRAAGIPATSQWLAGEGAGSWFTIDFENHLLKVTRYSVFGAIECAGLFENKDAIKVLKNKKSYKVAYPSDCKTVSLNLNGSEFRFNRTL